MSRLHYGDILSPTPIVSSIGTIIKPKLIDIAELTFAKYDIFQVFLNMTPEKFYVDVKKSKWKDKWNSLPEEQKSQMTMFDVALEDNVVQEEYLEIFNFFFDETVIFSEKMFFVIKNGVTEIKQEDIVGGITRDNFSEVIDLIKQICGLSTKEEEPPKMKNKLAEMIYSKIKKGQQKKAEEANKNLRLANIVSKVASNHHSLNWTNIWDITIFDLLDTFQSMQNTEMYRLDARRVSVWGDEKNTFKVDLWYKNNYDD